MCGAELTSLPQGVQRVAAALQSLGHEASPRMLSEAARTAQQAADLLGIELGQVAKSIVFRRLSDDAAVLVIASGDRRVDERKVAALVGPVGRADAAFVRARTGFAIGGVPPLAHATAPVTLIDRELLRFGEVWAAAGHPHAVFQLRPQDLDRLTDAPWADVTPGIPGSERALEIFAARARQARVAQGAQPSPCVSVCHMDPASGLCEGCYRTLDEIAAWSTMNEPGKRDVWRRIERRVGLQFAPQMP
ncbi:MAG: YbaK/EbsC family protein [Burkholderiaceae bacterium]|nr:YbaK/EbsC family protein [Burkholderiaceae bacterium]